MNQTVLKKRYGLNSKQLIEVLQSNLSELNQDGEHVVIEGTHCNLDEVAVERLDALLHYVPDLPAQSADTSKNALKAENEELKAQVEELKECLIKADATLKETIKNHRQEKKEYEKQLEELTQQVCFAQEGQKNLSDNLIRKFKNEADKAKTALEYEKEKAKDKEAALTKMVDELQSREKDYNEKLKKHLELRNECLKLQTEMTISGEEQQKLLRNLQEKNEYISNLEDLLNNTKATNKDYAMTNSLLIKDVNLAMKDFINVISNLQSSVEDHAISSESKKALVSEIEMVSNRQRRMMGGEEEVPQEEPAEQAVENVKGEEESQEWVHTEDTANIDTQEEAVIIPLEDKSKVKGEAKLSAENESLDNAIAVLRQSQEKQREEAKAENERKEKGIFARVASWFIA